MKMQKPPIKLKLKLMGWDEKMRVGDFDFDFETAFKRFKNWVANADQAVNKALDTAYMGFMTSVGMGTLADWFIRDACIICSIPQPSPHSQFLSRCGDYRPLVESFLVRGYFEKATNIAVMRACNASISFVMKNITGEEDVHTSMVAGFGYGVVISLVTGMRGPNVMSVGVMCALFNGVVFKASRRHQDVSTPKMNRITFTKTTGSE